LQRTPPGDGASAGRANQLEEEPVAPQRDPGREFDLQMAGYLWQMRQAWTSRRGFLRLAAGSAGAAALMAALGGPSEAAKRQILPGLFILEQDANQIVYGLEGDVRGLEPALSYDFTANPVACNISEGLMKFTPEGDIEPLIAEKFEQTDEVTYVYTLRDGVVFSDGTPVTMDDVIASIARVRDPEVAGPLAWMYDVPKAEVTKTDDKTLTIKLGTPSALFRFVTATTAGHVIPKAAIEKYGPDLLRNPVGTGPFKFVKWDAGSEIELEKNTNYWQKGKPYYDRFIFKIVTEGTTRVAGLKSGELNILGNVPPDQIENVTGFDNVDMQDVVGYTINLMALRTDKPPFNDVNIRKAISYATDLATIMEKIVGVTGVQSHNTAVPPNMPGSAADELKPIPYDVAKAKELMAASSMPDGFSTKLNVIAPNDVWVPQSIAIQEALKELNIDVEIVQYTYADFITLQQAGDYEGIMNFQWGSDFPDAAGNLIPLFLSTNTPPQNNHFYYNNPDVDKLLNDSESELDPEKRLEMLKEVQRKVSDDQPAIFLEHFKWFMPMTTNVTGYTLAPLWYWDSIGRDLVPATS
jgi:peptide/nickel transport system substrate-binding protein